MVVIVIIIGKMIYEQLILFIYELSQYIFLLQNQSSQQMGAYSQSSIIIDSINSFGNHEGLYSKQIVIQFRITSIYPQIRIQQSLFRNIILMDTKYNHH